MEKVRCFISYCNLDVKIYDVSAIVSCIKFEKDINIKERLMQCHRELIKGFFKYMNHNWIVKLLNWYIKDLNILWLVGRYMRRV